MSQHRFSCCFPFDPSQHLQPPALDTTGQARLAVITVNHATVAIGET